MYRIGIDVGGTGIKAGIVNYNGNIIGKGECRTNTESGFDNIVNDIANLVKKIVVENGLIMKDIKSVGLGIPGTINKKGEATCVNINWNNVPLINKLKELLPNIQVYAQNDATVAALAETKYGSMKGTNIGIMLTLGTGVGGGIVINEKVFSGAHGIASEFGHMIIGENFYNCNCGNNGCFETFCSATAIIKYAQKLINEGRKSIILEKANNNINCIDAKIVFDSYRENDEVAIEIINRFKNYLAIGISNLVHSFDPEVISLGGGVSRAHDIILDGLEELVKKHIIFEDVEISDIVIAQFGNDAGIIGSSVLS